jgi:hypothetical protein
VAAGNQESPVCRRNQRPNLGGIAGIIEQEQSGDWVEAGEIERGELIGIVRNGDGGMNPLNDSDLGVVDADWFI